MVKVLEKLRSRAARPLGIGVGVALLAAGTAVAVGLGLQNPGFDQGGLSGWTVKVDRQAGNGVAGDNQGKPNREVVYGPGGTKGNVVPCEAGDRYGVCLINGTDTFTTTSGTTKTVEPRTPSNMVRIGGPYLNPFQVQKDNHRYTVEQTFTVDSATPTLKVRHKMFTYDSAYYFQGRRGGRDRVEIAVYDSGGDLIRERQTWSSSVNFGEGKRLVASRWRAPRFNLSAYAGENVTLRVVYSGRRDELRGSWVYLDPANVTRASRPLTIALAGNGGGTVSGPGISCPPDCSQAYVPGAHVPLTATAAAGSAFAGFTGDCVGESCTLVMDDARSVGAVFNAAAVRDTAGPNVSLKGPKGKVKTKQKKAKVKFTFQADEAGATFKCAVDKGALSPCDSPFAPKLKVGKHTVRVQATDAAGNVGAEATAKVTVVRKKSKKGK